MLVFEERGNRSSSRCRIENWHPRGHGWSHVNFWRVHVRDNCLNCPDKFEDHFYQTRISSTYMYFKEAQGGTLREHSLQIEWRYNTVSRNSKGYGTIWNTDYSQTRCYHYSDVIGYLGNGKAQQKHPIFWTSSVAHISKTNSVTPPIIAEKLLEGND